MSLLSTIKRKSVTIASFSTSDAGVEYLRNGYYGIYNAAYGGGSGSAMTITPVVACVKIISEDIATIPCFVNERLADGSQQVAPSNSVYSLLHDSPNPDMTAVQFREAVTAHALLCGTGYAKIDRSAGDRDRVIALWPMQPNDVRRDKDRSGRTYFFWQGKTLTQRDVFQLHGFGTSGYEGMNILAQVRTALGLAKAQEEYAMRFFSQDQTPPLVLKHPGTLGPAAIANIKKAWKDHHQGPDRWHTPAVLQEAMDVVQLKPNARDSQLAEQRSAQLLEVCRIFRMPPHKLAEMGRATWGNISAQNTQYYAETLRPWLVRWEQAANLWLLGSSERYYVEHEIAGMLRGDFAMQTDGFRTLLASGVYSINEVRGYLNLNAIPGGDEHFIQINQGTVQDVAAGRTDVVDEPALQPVGA